MTPVWPLKQYSLLCHQGAGLLGVYMCAYLHDQGYTRVYCTDTSMDRLLLTQKFGATPLSKCESKALYYKLAGVPGVARVNKKIMV